VLHLSASFSLFRLFFLFLVGSLSCLVVAGVAEVLCVCVCVCVYFMFPGNSALLD
jgi:hypothetical protein